MIALALTDRASMRGVVQRAVDRDQQKPNLCAMQIDGEKVVVDLNSFAGDGLAVVLEHDGRIRIQEVEAEYIGHRPFGARTALGERYRSPHGGVARSSVAVIGMVVGVTRRITIDGELT